MSVGEPVLLAVLVVGHDPGLERGQEGQVPREHAELSGDARRVISVTDRAGSSRHIDCGEGILLSTRSVRNHQEQADQRGC